jgi:sec-independent protein translocase protein TatB
MFGLGFSELIILAIVGLVFIGPKQLPEVMKGVGRFFREITNAKEEFKQTVDQDESLRSIRKSVDDIKDSVQNKVEDIKSDIKGQVDKDL